MARLLSTLDRRTLAALIVCLVAVFAIRPAVAQSPTFVPGTGVGLVPPKGMVPARAFSGFEDIGTGASILVAEFPAEAYASIVPNFTPEALAANGLEQGKPAVDWKIPGIQGGRLIRGRQKAHGGLFRKWVLLGKGAASTLMVSVQVPDQKSGVLTDAAVEAALKTVVAKAPPTLPDQVAALPFKLDDFAGFRVVRVFAGSGLLLTDGPRDTIADASQPVVIVANALGTVSVDDKAARESLAQQAFATIAGVSDVSIVSQKMEERDGVTWSRIEGRGTYRNSSEAVATLQVIRFDKNGYIRTVAIMRTLGAEPILARADALAASVTPK